MHVFICINYKLFSSCKPSLLTAAQEALNNLEDYDKTCLESALQGVSNIVQQEWGSTCPCQVLCVLLSTQRDEHNWFLNWCLMMEVESIVSQCQYVVSCDCLIWLNSGD